MANCIEEAEHVVKKEKVEESKRSDESGQLYNILFQYLNKLRSQNNLKRYLFNAIRKSSEHSSAKVKLATQYQEAYLILSKYSRDVQEELESLHKS